MLGGSKVTIENLLLVEPLGAQELFLTRLVWVIVDEVGHHIVFLLIFRQKTVMVLPVVLVHSNVERSILADHSLLALLLLPLILLMLQVHGVLIWQPFIITEKTASSECGDFGRRLSPDKIAILLIIHHFSNGIW